MEEKSHRPAGDNSVPIEHRSGCFKTPESPLDVEHSTQHSDPVSQTGMVTEVCV